MANDFGTGRRYVLEDEGLTIAFEVRDCRVCLGGEFAGNLDLRIACEPEVAERLVHGLALRLPGHADPVFVLGHGREAGDFSFTFGSQLGDAGEVPEELTLLWGEKPLDTLPCRLVATVPLDEGRLLDPGEILQGTGGLAGAPIRRGALRGPIVSALTSLLLAAGVFLAAKSIHAEGPVFTPMLGGSAMLLFTALFPLILMLIPYQQLRIDPARGTVEVITGRNVFFVFRVRASTLYRGEDFAHVRIVERAVGGGIDEQDQSVWLVSLEGPVRWEGDAPHTDIHERADAVPLGQLGSQPAARRLAACVGQALGLRVLDTSVTEA